MQVISGVNNSAFFAQSAYSASTASYDVNGYPITSYLPESGVGYNAVNEVSALNGSAIAQYGAEKQFLVHDDTLCHLSNSAQFALGVNLSAVAQLLGVDETLLWSGTIDNTTTTATLNENISSFNKVKILCKLNTNTNDAPKYFEFNIDGTHTQYSMLGGIAASNGNCYIGHASISIVDTTVSYTAGNQMQFGQAPTDNKNATIYEIIGIGRKQ